MTKHKKNTCLQQAGCKIIKNADFVAAGLCLTFALAGIPALMNTERGSYWQPLYSGYENALYTDARQETMARLKAALPADEYAAASAMDQDALSRFLFEKRRESDELEQILNLHRRSAAPFHQDDIRDGFNKVFGTASSIAFGLLGAGFAAGGIARLRGKSKPQRRNP